MKADLAAGLAANLAVDLTADLAADLAAALPESLAGFAPRVAVGPAPGCVAAREIASGDAYAALSAPFARRFPRADQRALLSFWTQYYFAALIVPALAAADRLGRVLPLALDAVAVEPDGEGTVACLRLAHVGTDFADDPSIGDAPTPKARGAGAVAATLDALAADHLRPFIEGCAGWSGLSPRVMWCNAGVMLDWAAGELGVALPACPGLNATEAALLAPFRAGGACAGCPRKRRTCCLRLRLAGVPCCGASCPLEA